MRGKHSAPEARLLPDGIRFEIRRRGLVDAPCVSVVLPAYNRVGLIKQAVESVLALDKTSVELIVVDDGSTDGTIAALDDLTDPRVTVAAIEGNAGANVARNLGISLARAAHVAFLDSDDLYLPGRLSRPANIFASHPEIGIVVSSFLTEKHRKSTVSALPDRTYSGDELRRLAARYVLHPGTSGLSVRRELLVAVGGFDPTLARIQDRDLVMRVASRTRGASLSGSLWIKRWQPDGISTGRHSYFSALMAFISRHPIYQSDELESRDYLIARHLVALAKARKWRQLHLDYRHARNVLAPRPASLMSLFRDYWLVRRRRRLQQTELQELGVGMAPPSPHWDAPSQRLVDGHAANTST